MPLVVTAGNGGSAKLDPDTYHVACIGVREDRIENDKFGHPEKVRFDLEVKGVIDPETGLPAVIDAMCNKVLSPKSNLWRWCEAFGLKPELGKPLDLESARGCEVFAIVAQVESDAGAFSRVTDLMPMPRAQRMTGLAPAPQASVINPDGSSNWTAFWSAITKAGLNRGHVIDHVGGDIETVMVMDGPTAQNVLDELTAKAS